jgi:hypothetical protein
MQYNVKMCFLSVDPLSAWHPDQGATPLDPVQGLPRESRPRFCLSNNSMARTPTPEKNSGDEPVPDPVEIYFVRFGDLENM